MSPASISCHWPYGRGRRAGRPRSCACRSRVIAGKILLIWDGSPIHHGQAVKDFLRTGAAQRLQLEQLPGYAPDLNPDEGIWNYLKRAELGNVCCTDLADLRHRLLRAAVRVRHKPDIIRACSRQCGYLL